MLLEHAKQVPRLHSLVVRKQAPAEQELKEGLRVEAAVAAEHLAAVM